MQRYGPRTALIVVDLQNDFSDPAGGLSVTNGDAIIPTINREIEMATNNDAIVVATPTGSTAYSFSAGGPIVSPAVEALLVTPAAPHSAYNRGLVVSVNDELTLQVLPYGLGGHATPTGFTILRFAEPDLPDVVYVENLASALYLDKPTEVERYLLAMERLSIMAHDPQRTTEILDEIIKELEAARDE